MRFCVLGRVEAWEDGQELPLGSARQRTLLTLLLLHADEVVSRDRLIDGLWGERPPPSAAKVLQGYISQLRRALPPETIVTSGSGYSLRNGETDAIEFERLVERAHGEEAHEAARTLREALALWRGRALAEVEYEDWAQAEISRLEELRLVALEARIEADLQLGESARVVPELETLVAGHPLRERLQTQLMLALYRSGRQPDALDVYAAARRRLVDELGIEPGRSLRELHQAILRQDPGLDLVATAEAVAEAPRGAFVGREPELAELVAGFDDALSGRGRLFLLVGEPGIGKSRLADEVISHAAARGARVLVGRCWEAGGAPAYWPWVQALRVYIRATEPETLRAQLGAGAAGLALILPELRETLPDLPEPAPPDSEGARFRLFDGVAEFLRTASARRPILLVLDDLHAADASSLLLLQFVARELASTHVLLVAALRDVDPIRGRHLTTMLAEVAREPGTRQVSLGGLSKQDVASYLELTASELSSPGLVDALHEQTEGNPLFVGETVRLLSVEGVRTTPSGAKIAIPQSVHDVIARRLAHLTEECNRVLVLASVLGRDFALDALARMSALSEDELLERLDEAMIARVVSELPGGSGRVRFAHVLIRDTLYDGLTTARRVLLHRRAVATLEALHAEAPGPHLAELVHHSIAGSEFDKGVRYARLAADRALASLAYEEAARLYELALDGLELAGVRDEKARCELLLSLGRAEEAGDRRAAKQAFLEAAEIARRLDLPHELARAAAGYGGRIPWTRAAGDDRLVPLLEEALAGLAEEDVELRARLLSRLAGALRGEHSRDRRDTISKEAVDLARRANDGATLAYALDGRAAAIIAPDTVAECLALGSELRDVAAGIGDTELVLAGHSLRYVVQVLTGDVEAAEVDLAAEQRIADELKQPVELFHACAARAMLALAAGRLDEAGELVPQAFALGERAQPEMAMPIYGLQWYTLCDFRGSLDEVEPTISSLTAEYPARPVFRCALACLYARLGRMPEAQRVVDELAADDFSVLPFDLEWLYGMSLLAETCVVLSDTDSAEVLYRLLVPWAAFNAADPHEGIRGSVSRYLGMLGTSMRRWDDAELHFEEALEANSRMGARPWLAHTQLDFARMLLARDETGDRERAQELRDKAVATYRDLGMDGYAA